MSRWLAAFRSDGADTSAEPEMPETPRNMFSGGNGAFGQAMDGSAPVCAVVDPTGGRVAHLARKTAGSPAAPAEGPETAPWTDDRAWIADIRAAANEASKLAILAAWVTAAGGETVGRTMLLLALRPPRERRVAEVELRRMIRQFGLEVLEDRA